MATIKLGTAGQRIDIDLRVGDTLGPYTISEAAGTGVAAVPINLTGCVITGAISRRGAPDGDTPLTIVNIDLAQGTYSFELTAAQSTMLLATDFFAADAAYAYKLTITYPNGTTYTRLYGLINVMQKGLS